MIHVVELSESEGGNENSKLLAHALEIITMGIPSV